METHYEDRVYAFLMKCISANCKLLECWLKKQEKQKPQSFPSLKVVLEKR